MTSDDVDNINRDHYSFWQVLHKGFLGVGGFVVAQLVAQKDMFVLWWPIFFGCGIGVYFSLSFEPPVFMGVAATLIMISFLVSVWRHLALRIVGVVVFLCVAGFMMAQLHTLHVASPMLAKKTRTVVMVGEIAVIEDLEAGKGRRVVLRDLTVERLAPADTPQQVRVRIRGGAHLVAGQRVKALGQLMPPSAPLMPGGFDFQRFMFFQKIGAVGFTYGTPEILEEAPPAQISLVLQHWREAIAARVKNILGARRGAIAVALLTAERSAIREEDHVAMRESGLAHILAVSGLHVGLFSGVIFFMVRLLMASIPGMALRYPIKKYAAVLAFIGACFYGMLAGFPVSMQRALIMIGIVFLAVLLDRSPFSLRLVAFAALCVLVINPASLISVSFHLSFAAVTALIVFYEFLRPYWSRWYSERYFLKTFALYFLGVCLTTVIASSATAPLALYHFQQMSLFGNAANLVAVPLMAFVIMPAAVLALFLMPLGLEAWSLQVMGWGIGYVLDVAHYFSTIPGAMGRVSVFPLAGILCLVMAFFCGFLLRGWLRLTALPFLAVCVLVMVGHRLPDILISQHFDLVMVRGEDGALYLSSKRKEKFIAENWQQAYGVESGIALKFPYEGESADGLMGCDPSACRMVLKGKDISYVRDRTVLAQECKWADLVIVADFVRGAPCRVLSKSSGYREGAHGVYLEDEIRITTTEEYRGLRPWVARPSKPR